MLQRSMYRWLANIEQKLCFLFFKFVSINWCPLLCGGFNAHLQEKFKLCILSSISYMHWNVLVFDIKDHSDDDLNRYYLHGIIAAILQLFDSHGFQLLKRKKNETDSFKGFWLKIWRQKVFPSKPWSKLWLSEIYELDFLLRHFAGNFWFQKSIYMYVFVCVYLSIYLSICVYEYMFCKVILTCSVI